MPPPNDKFHRALPSPQIIQLYRSVNMNTSFLFALDLKTEEIVVSESPKGSKQIHLVERIRRQDNGLLYDAVTILTNLTLAPDFDAAIFKAMDKVCQLLYNKQKKSL